MFDKRTISWLRASNPKRCQNSENLLARLRWHSGSGWPLLRAFATTSCRGRVRRQFRAPSLHTPQFSVSSKPPTEDRVCAKQGVWSPNPLFCNVRPQNPTQNKLISYKCTSLCGFQQSTPHTLPSASQEIPSCSPQKESPKTAAEREAAPTPTPPTPQPAPPQRERERERERGQTNLPQIDPNYSPEKTINAHPKREGRLWFSINAVYDFGPKTINAVYDLRGLR